MAVTYPSLELVLKQERKTSQSESERLFCCYLLVAIYKCKQS